MVRFDSFFFFFSPTYTSVLRERERVGIERTKFVKQTNPRFGKVRLTNNSFRRVSSIDAASDTLIVDLSIERKVTLQDRFCWYGFKANPTFFVPVGNIGEKSTTPRNRNQQEKNFVRNYRFPDQYQSWEEWLG